MGFPPLPPQLLNSLSVNPDAKCKYGLYFRDGKRKVDYVLVYHHKRGSGSRTLARRVLQNDAAVGTRSLRPEQPLPGKGRQGAAREQEPPMMDFHEDDKRFRREEYEGNLLEAGLELEHDEEVTVPLPTGVVGLEQGGVERGGRVSMSGACSSCFRRWWGRVCPLSLKPGLREGGWNAVLVKVG